MKIYVDGVEVLLKDVYVILGDGTRTACRTLSEEEKKVVLECGYATTNITVDNGIVSIDISSPIPLRSVFVGEFVLDIKGVEKVLALTLHPSYAYMYRNAFSYYNPLAVDRTPTAEKPPDAPEYPPKAASISYADFVKSFPCWTYPSIISPESIPLYTVFILLKLGNKFGAIATWSSGDLTAYIGEGLKIKLFTGSSRTIIRRSVVATIAFDEDPYKAVEKVVEKSSKVLPLKLRRFKKEPVFLKYFGWCSWNALLTEDLNHENVVKIVRGLIERGVPIKWAIIDDGWQKEVRKGREWFLRVLADLNADDKKFPGGFSRTVEELKKLGLELVGLWHTINIHWGGFEKNVVEKLGIEGYKVPFVDSYVPPPQLEKAIEFYTAFHRWVKNQGFDFVKIDNQWSIHALYQGLYTSAEAARNIQIALQISSQVNSLDILNCMSMAPEDYSNYFASNVMRISIDYIPFWKAEPKLHTLFSVYNSLFFNYIAYPDYDMWISYDPYAKIYAITRVFSGGPIYITDRHPEKTDINLIKSIVLPDGEAVRVDEPGLPTRDILFRDPYNEKVLLKIASKSKHTYAVALININREGVEIEDEVSLEDLPYKVEEGNYVYYMVFSGKWGIITPRERIKVSLKELEAEIIIFTPIKNNKAIIGLKEYLLPPYPIEIIETNSKLYIRSRVEGTLIYIENNILKQIKVQKESITEL
jgi:hypothetical protein